ncbi:hypothetical protein ACSMXN_13235 [Jatrophihabitans sp. DSM 45814]
MKQSRSPRFALPHWTTNPGFGVAVLLAVAVLLIVHGEPQPSSRPSGKSVVVSGSPTAPVDVPATLVIHQDEVDYKLGTTVHRVLLPAAARPRSVLTNRGLSVVLAAVGDRQHAYAVTQKLQVIDLGLADAVLPAVQGTAAVIVEVALADPGRLDFLAPKVSPSSSEARSSSDGPSGSQSSSSSKTGNVVLRDFGVRRYDASGRMTSALFDLPRGTRAATDTTVGLVAWQPLNQVFDGSVPLEPLSATAVLIRPNGTLRPIGTVYPLAATQTDLLVWDVQRREFGIMPLTYVTSTATTTVSPSASSSGLRPPAKASSNSSAKESSSSEHSGSATPSATPTAVAGTRWYEATRGLTVTGPASFSPDGSAFAVYAQVGSRRRLAVAQLDKSVGNQIEVLALTAPLVKPSSNGTNGPSDAGDSRSSAIPSDSLNRAGTSPLPGGATPTGSSSPGRPGDPNSPSTATSPEAPAFEQDGFPIPAPLLPTWWGGFVVAVGSEGAVVRYQPGNAQAALLDLGVKDIQSIADAP